MSFLSRFPFFDKDEVAPSESNVIEKVTIDFSRVLARIQAFSQLTNRFNFLRSDGAGRLLISNGFYDNPNRRFLQIITQAGMNTLAPRRDDRQILSLMNTGTYPISIYAGSASEPIYSFRLMPGDAAILYSFTLPVYGLPDTAGSNFWIAEA